MERTKFKKIIDGDTFQGSHNKFFRLADIDAPEKRERGYQKAKEDLQNFIKGEELIVKTVGRSHNRDVVEIRKPGEKITINAKMKRKGWK